jgi:exodeoxyribonuclease VII large subunit
MTLYFPSLLVPETALSVAGLTAYIQETLEHDPQLQQVWVTGEVSSANRHRSGLFFTLQDPDAQASIQCIVWSSQLDKLVTLPTPGEQSLVLGRLNVHAQRGQYQLIIWQVLPAGEGLRALRYRQLRQRLEAEGLFDPQRKRSLPLHPQTIAVVTSLQAAAWGDIQRTLRSRYPGLHVLFSPALVQGEQAPLSIVKALRRIERDGRSEVIIVARGGGATEDLACFNDERVVRAIAECSIPIISGIGHQRDETLADLVADVCAHTPTAAAELVVPELTNLMTEHQERRMALQMAIRQCWQAQQEQLHRLRLSLQRVQPHRKIQQQQQRLSWLTQHLIQATRQRHEFARQHCQLLKQELEAINPASVLSRGYALVRKPDGQVLRDTNGLEPGQVLHIQLQQGLMQVQFISILSDSASHPSFSETLP